MPRAGAPRVFLIFRAQGRALQSELCAPPPSSRARAYLYIISSSAVCELCAAPSSRRGVLNDIYFMSRALCSLSFMYAARALFARAKRCSLSYTYVISSEMQRCSTQRSLINTHRLSIGLHIRPPRMFQGDRQMLGVSISLRLHYSDLTPDKTSILGCGMVFNVLYTAWPTKFLQILPIRHVVCNR